MARIIEYDKEEVFFKATNFFWEHGFHKSSVDELVNNLGVHRGSVYAHFGDKRTFYLKCLKAYIDQEIEMVLNLKYEEDIQGLLRWYMLTVISGYVKDKKLRGCFLVNALNEFGNSDKEVYALIETYRERFIGKFEELLLLAKEKGELNVDESCKVLAAYLLNLLMGIKSMSRTGSGATTLRQVADLGLDIFSNRN